MIYFPFYFQERVETLCLSNELEIGLAFNLILLVSYYQEWFERKIGHERKVATVLKPLADLIEKLNGLLDVVNNAEVALLKVNAEVVFSGADKIAEGFALDSPLPGEAIQNFTSQIVSDGFILCLSYECVGKREECLSI